MIEKTERGFKIIRFNDRNGERCSLQQSSAIDDVTGAMENPGTSFVWLGVEIENGKRMHLDRKQVQMLVSAMQHWLDNGSFC